MYCAAKMHLSLRKWCVCFFWNVTTLSTLPTFGGLVLGRVEGDVCGKYLCCNIFQSLAPRASRTEKIGKNTRLVTCVDTLSYSKCEFWKRTPHVSRHCSLLHMWNDVRDTGAAVAHTDRTSLTLIFEIGRSQFRMTWIILQLLFRFVEEEKNRKQ